MFQRISLSWLLSELSPVWIANCSELPSTGPAPSALTARTMESATCADRISWGRYAELNRPIVGALEVPGSSNRSNHSSRAGDWWSTTCTSVSWTKVALWTRAAARFGAAAMPTSVRTTWGSGAAMTTFLYPRALGLPTANVDCSVLRARRALARAGDTARADKGPSTWLPTSTTAPRAPPWITERREMSTSSQRRNVTQVTVRSSRIRRSAAARRVARSRSRAYRGDVPLPIEEVSGEARPSFPAFHALTSSIHRSCGTGSAVSAPLTHRELHVLVPPCRRARRPQLHLA